MHRRTLATVVVLTLFAGAGVFFLPTGCKKKSSTTKTGSPESATGACQRV